MTSTDTTAPEIAALARYLEINGGDPARWPSGEISRWEALLTRSAEARRLLAEARALDALLDAFPEPEPARRSALADRILATALADPAPSVTGGVVVPFEARRATKPAAFAPVRRGRDWRAAGLMAASLLVGLWVGTSGALLPLLDGRLTGDGEMLALVLEEGSGSALEEVSYE